MIISSNHNVFFITLAVILLVVSIRKVYITVFNVKPALSEVDKETEADFQEMTNLDTKKFGTGIKVAKSLFTILFFSYCTFFINSIWIKLLISLITVYFIHDIVNSLKSSGDTGVSRAGSKLKVFLDLAVNISIIIIILLVGCNKFFRNII